MQSRRNIETLIAASFFLLAMTPASFAQPANSNAPGQLAAPNNDAGSGGSRAPGTEFSGPHRTASEASNAADEPSDKAITKAVKEKLAGDASTRNSSIVVTTEDRMVILHGRVGSLQTAKKAEALVASVTGVKGVEDQLEYDNPSPRND
jgi:BON domain-containing protein